MFEVCSYKQRFDANKVKLVNQSGHPYIVRQSTDNGQKGFIVADEQYLNPGNTISFGQDTATMFYQEKPYFTGDKIKILRPRFQQFGKACAQFFLTSMRIPFSSFSWGTQSFSVAVIEDQQIELPQTAKGEIDFAFMENFIRELEESRLRELEAYLQASGLSDYHLSPAEEAMLNDISALNWQEYNVTDLFEIRNTHNILSSEIQPNSGLVPYLCASASNNSVSSYINHNLSLLEKGNCIFIGGKTFVVSYQEHDFFSNDSHNLALYMKGKSPSKKTHLFLATCVRMGMGYKYTWGNSISNRKIQDDTIMLPTRADGKPDLEVMELLISAVQKVVIRDVVQYTDCRIAATRRVIAE